MSLKKLIPNTVTCLNLSCGILGVAACFEGYYEWAFPLMLLASVFDFCDGLAARMLDAYSPMGKELDSLSDMVSFGVLPSVMLLQLMVMHGVQPGWACFIPLALAVFSGLRLAKFNVDERQADHFIGLPTPACAIICGALCHFTLQTDSAALSSVVGSPWCLPVLALVLGVLLVSEIPMFSMKIHKGESLASLLDWRRVTWLVAVVGSVVVTLVLKFNWAMIPLASFGAYVLVNLIPGGRKKAA